MTEHHSLENSPRSPRPYLPIFLVAFVAIVAIKVLAGTFLMSSEGIGNALGMAFGISILPWLFLKFRSFRSAAICLAIVLAIVAVDLLVYGGQA